MSDGSSGVGGHGAAPALLGYAYQVEVALVELIRRAKVEPGTSLSIETLDDVTFEVGGEPLELLQTKHHIAGTGNLSDRSRDLWKTLRVWVDAIKAGDAAVPGATFSLLTTATAPSGSAASMLRGEGRDEDSARTVLELTAGGGGGPNASDYAAFLGLDAEVRGALIQAIVVLDRAPLLSDLQTELASELGWALRPRFRPQMTDRLVQWWNRRVVEHLLHGQQPISAEEVYFEIDSLRDELTAENLPIDVSLADADAQSLSDDERTFIHQLHLISLSHPSVELAIRDYKRAFLQRERWTEDALVTSRELGRYEGRLIDEWQHVAAAHWEGANGDEQHLQAGKDVYNTLQFMDLWIRPDCQERFVSRGSYHMLANDLRVGWHPQFLTRLREVLRDAT